MHNVILFLFQERILMNFSTFLIKLAYSAFIIFIAFLIGPRLKRLIEKGAKHPNEKGAVTFIGSLVSIGTKALGIIVALGQMGVDTSVIVGAFSALGLGISLALKNNMSNVAGGLQIILTKPFTVGDYISIGDKEGTVLKIETMFTTLATYSGQDVIIPNSSCVSEIIVNYSIQPNRRIAIQIPVSLHTDVEAFQEEINKIMNADERILKDPAPHSALTSFSANGQGIVVTAYSYTPIEQYWDVLYDLNLAFQKKRLDANIAQPYDSIQIISDGASQTHEGSHPLQGRS